MKRMLLPLLVLSVALLSGCAGTIPTESYTPQNFVRYENKNDVNVGEFTYVPLAAGKLKPNQIQNRAIGGIYISTNVNDMVRRITALELEKTGLLLTDRALVTITGDILEFKADDLGYSVHWTYAIAYTIRDAGGVTLHKQEYRPAMKKTGKFGMPADLAPVIHEMVLNGYDMFINDPAVRLLLDKRKQ